jgi:2-polyprenyl-3-methyl-5-hydroxy-6-metoxy-1,4-benzoquinol methylase
VLGGVRRRLGLGAVGAVDALRAAQGTWERLAQRDPFWAVLTDPRRRGQGWNADEFFATGALEIERVFAYLESRGIAVSERGLALDFGCGLGRLTRALAARMAEVHGVDASATMIERARELSVGAPGRMTFLLNQDADLRQLGTGRYAFVYSSLVLQHIPPPGGLGYVMELMRVAKPGGLVVFQAATRDRSGLRPRAWAAARRMAHALGVPVDDLRIEMHAIPEREILWRARAAGCQVLDVAFTNSVSADVNGALEFWHEDRGQRLVSQQFVLRRR